MNKPFGILIIVCAVILVLSFVGTASANNWSVDASGGSNFTGIQAALNNASTGDMILVYPGVYYENVVANKSVTLKGIGNPVVDASGSGIPITLRVDGVILDGFSVTGSGSSWEDAGIKIISCDNIITGNNVSNNEHGIHIHKSGNNSVTGNDVNNNRCYGIALFSSADNTITDNDVSENKYGFDLFSSHANIITDNNVCNNRYGIRLDESGNNDIAGNNVSSNNDDGFRFRYSNNNTIAGNTVSNCGYSGFNLWYYSSNNTITGNNVCSNRYGIRFDESSDNNSIIGNTIRNNDDGIYLRYSNNNNISGNTFVNGALFVANSYKNRVDGNIVNGKPLVYLEDASDIAVIDAGQVILVNCTNISVENLNLSNTSVSVELWKTEKSGISNNTVCNTRDGIYLLYSSNNTITGNNLSSNKRSGLFLRESNSSKIYLNNFINNGDAVLSFCSTNIWNSTEEITYIYNGTTYKSYVGNYWDEYDKKYPDAAVIGTTGIWDSPYCIDKDSDFYPLTMRFENYLFHY